LSTCPSNGWSNDFDNWLETIAPQITKLRAVDGDRKISRVLPKIDPAKLQSLQIDIHPKKCPDVLPIVAKCINLRVLRISGEWMTPATLLLVLGVFEKLRHLEDLQLFVWGELRPKEEFKSAICEFIRANGTSLRRAMLQSRVDLWEVLNIDVRMQHNWNDLDRSLRKRLGDGVGLDVLRSKETSLWTSVMEEGRPTSGTAHEDLLDLCWPLDRSGFSWDCIKEIRGELSTLEKAGAAATAVASILCKKLRVILDGGRFHMCMMNCLETLLKSYNRAENPASFQPQVEECGEILASIMSLHLQWLDADVYPDCAKTLWSFPREWWEQHPGVSSLVALDSYFNGEDEPTVELMEGALLDFHVLRLQSNDIVHSCAFKNASLLSRICPPGYNVSKETIEYVLNTYINLARTSVDIFCNTLFRRDEMETFPLLDNDWFFQGMIHISLQHHRMWEQLVRAILPMDYETEASDRIHDYGHGYGRGYGYGHRYGTSNSDSEFSEGPVDHEFERRLDSLFRGMSPDEIFSKIRQCASGLDGDEEEAPEYIDRILDARFVKLPSIEFAGEPSRLEEEE
jgi:hypothetical protein